MQWSRVKSILIVMLLLVDCFLGCMLGVKAVSAYQRKAQTREHLNTVLASYGMELAQGISLPDDALMPQLSIDRNRADEAAAASALLGGSADRSEGEDGSQFVSSEGQVIWQENGHMRAYLKPAAYQCPEPDQVRLRAQELLESAGLSVSGMEWEVDGLSATASFKTAGYEVFNRSITVAYSEDAIRISGLWTFGTPYATRSDLYASYNPTDALLLFAGSGQAKRIQSITPGLLLTNAAGNQFQLTPVWQIRTDNGTFFVDPLKNEVV